MKKLCNNATTEPEERTGTEEIHGAFTTKLAVTTSPSDNVKLVNVEPLASGIVTPFTCHEIVIAPEFGVVAVNVIGIPGQTAPIEEEVTSTVGKAGGVIVKFNT